MKITGISAQLKDPNRVNVMVDGKYRLSLDIYQLGSLGVKVGREYDEQELTDLEEESEFGKMYARALEYCLMRPHSAREVQDYLYRKTRTVKVQSRRTGEIKERHGVSQKTTERVFERLVQKGYIDDNKFAKFWVENRNLTKGTSQRKLQAELQAKGVERSIIDTFLSETDRSDIDELKKIAIKKRLKYPDEQKFIQYLARQGFSYSDIKSVLSSEES